LAYLINSRSKNLSLEPSSSVLLSHVKIHFAIEFNPFPQHITLKSTILLSQNLLQSGTSNLIKKCKFLKILTLLFCLSNFTESVKILFILSLFSLSTINSKPIFVIPPPLINCSKTSDHIMIFSHGNACDIGTIYNSAISLSKITKVYFLS